MKLNKKYLVGVGALGTALATAVLVLKRRSDRKADVERRKKSIRRMKAH